MGKIDLHSIFGFIGPSSMARFNWGGGMSGFGGGFGGYGPAGIEGDSMGGTMPGSDPHEFNGSAIRFGFDRLVETYTQELVQTGLAGDAAHQEAYNRALVAFNTARIPTFVDWAMREKKGEVKPATWIIVETEDGKKELMNPQTGEEWDQMWDNAREFQQRDATFRYDPAEHQAHREIKQRILTDAQTIVYFMNDVSGQRYAVQLVREGNRVVSESVDVSTVAGRALKAEETRPVLEQLFSNNKDAGAAIVKNRSQPYLVLQKERIEAQQIKAIVGEVLKSNQRDTYTNSKPRVEPQRRMPTEALGERERAPEIVSLQHQGLPKGSIDTSGNDTKARIAASDRRSRREISPRTGIVSHTADTVVQASKAVALETLTSVITLRSYLREKKRHKAHKPMMESVREQLHRVFRRKNTARQKEGVASAQPKTRTHARETQNKEIAAVEKSVRRHEKRELRMKNKELRIRREKQTKTRRERGKIRKVYAEIPVGRRRYTERERKKRKHRNAALPRRQAGAEKVSMPKKEKRRRLRRKKRDVEIGVKKIAAAKELIPKRKRETREKWEKRKKKEIASQEVVLRSWKGFAKRERRLAFAWMVWMSLKRSHPARQGETLKKPVERIVPMEETPWILLSIIWFLTMRKEGNVAQPAPTYQTTTVTGAAPSIPQYAVIFAYAS